MCTCIVAVWQTHLDQCEAVIPHCRKDLSSVLALCRQRPPELIKGSTVHPKSAIGKGLAARPLQSCFMGCDFILCKFAATVMRWLDVPKCWCMSGFYPECWCMSGFNRAETHCAH